MSNVKTKVWGTDLKAMVAATDKAEGGRERKGTRIMDAQMFAPFRSEPPVDPSAQPVKAPATPSREDVPSFASREDLPSFAGREPTPKATRILPIEDLISANESQDAALVPSLKPRRTKLIAYALLTLLSVGTWSFAKLRKPRVRRAVPAAIESQASAAHPQPNFARARPPAPVQAAPADPRSGQTARAAVDALARGDRDLAAQLYKELSSEDQLFAAAARILSTPPQ